MKDRARPQRLKVENTPKKQVKMINAIIKELTPERPDLTNINQLKYTGATLITSKIVPSKQGTNRKAGKSRILPWKQRHPKQIEEICKDISIISEHTRGNQSANISRKLKRLMKRFNVTSKEQEEITSQHSRG